jgi:hypothetical protein
MIINYLPKERLNITLDPSGAIAKICIIPLEQTKKARSISLELLIGLPFM